MIDLASNVSQMRDKVTAGLYLSLALALAVMGWYHYLLGHYSQILWPALSSPFVLVLALIRFFQPKDSRNITPYPLLLIVSLVLLNGGPLFDPLYRQWLYMMPLLAYFILPVRQASISLLLFFILFISFAVDQMNPVILADVALHLSLFSGISFIFAFSQENQTRTLERLSGKDSLTGAFSANQLNKRLEAEVARAKATRRPLSALMFTVNNLDEFTVHHGEHQTRNLLVKISRTMQEVSRTGDEIYRTTDSRFLLLLPNTSINGCIVLKERLLQQIAEHVELEAVIHDLSMNVATLQASEDARQFLERTLCEPNEKEQRSL